MTAACIPEPLESVTDGEQLEVLDGAPGRVLLEYWDGVPGNRVADLTTDIRFPRRPTGRAIVTSALALPERGDAYGTRIRGYVRAPTSGGYRFFVTGDNEVQLRISTNASPANLRVAPVARVLDTQWTRPDEWTKYGGQASSLVWLVAGERYFFEVLHKEGTGGDGVAVGWQLPDGTLERPVPAGRLTPWEPETDPGAAPPPEADILDTLATGHPRLMASGHTFERLRRELPEDSALASRAAWLAAGMGGTHASPPVDRTRRVKCDLETGADLSADRLLLIPPCVRIMQDALRILDTSREVLRRIEVLATVYRIRGDVRYARRAIEELVAIGAAGWGDFNAKHFLDTAELGRAFALGYDWLYDAMTPAQRGEIRSAIRSKVLEPGLREYDVNRMQSGHWSNTQSNWNHVCNAGLVMSALAVADEEPALSRAVVYRAVASFKRTRSLEAFAPDGAFAEGPGYWEYATRYIAALLSSLETARGGDFGLGHSAGLSEAGMMPLYSIGPSGYLFNFADTGETKASPSPAMHYFAQRYLRSEYARSAASALGGTELVWWNRRLAASAGGALPLDKHFRRVDIAMLRSKRTTDAIWLGFKAGDNRVGHSHLDLGSFVLDALGTRWAVDLGAESYGAVGQDYFDAQKRWHFYRTRAEGHNTLVIEPSSGPDQAPSAAAKILAFRSTASTGAVVADLGAAYASSGATSVRRGARIDRDSGHVFVQDEVRAAHPVDVWWFMHTRASVTIAAGRREAILSDGNRRLYVKVLSPDSGLFTLRDASPLPTSPAPPPGAATNTGVRKLSIHLPNVTTTTLTILFVPLPEGTSPPADPQLPPALAAW